MFRHVDSKWILRAMYVLKIFQTFAVDSFPAIQRVCQWSMLTVRPWRAWQLHGWWLHEILIACKYLTAFSEMLCWSNWTRSILRPGIKWPVALGHMDTKYMIHKYAVHMQWESQVALGTADVPWPRTVFWMPCWNLQMSDDTWLWEGMWHACLVKSRTSVCRFTRAGVPREQVLSLKNWTGSGRWIPSAPHPSSFWVWAYIITKLSFHMFSLSLITHILHIFMWEFTTFSPEQPARK